MSTASTTVVALPSHAATRTKSTTTQSEGGNTHFDKFPRIAEAFKQSVSQLSHKSGSASGNEASKFSSQSVLAGSMDDYNNDCDAIDEQNSNLHSKDDDLPHSTRSGLSPRDYLPAILKPSSFRHFSTASSDSILLKKAVSAEHTPSSHSRSHSTFSNLNSSSWHVRRHSSGSRNALTKKNAGGEQDASSPSTKNNNYGSNNNNSSPSSSSLQDPQRRRRRTKSAVELDTQDLKPPIAHTSYFASSMSLESELYSLNSSSYQLTESGSFKEDIGEEMLESSEAHETALNFAAEHRIFLHAALALLAERDRQAPKLGMRDPVVLKAGALKKASHLMNGVWKVKFVEVRRGMFSYYENVVKKKNDVSGEDELLRKDIPLEANMCSCRAVKLHQKAINLTPGGSIFELSVNGSKRLWMAKTRADRHLWMQTIQNAMVGGSVTRGNTIVDDAFSGSSPQSPFKTDLRKYIKAQIALRNAKSRSEYVLALKSVSERALHVPVKWIAKQSVGEADLTESIAFREESVDTSVEQLWKDLQRDSVMINREYFNGDTGHGPEKIIGALVRVIMGVGHERDEHSGYTQAVRSDLPESQALSYARDILLSGNRTRSGGDSYFCVNTLCKNEDLTVVVPALGEAEPLIIEVDEDESDLAFYSRVLEKTGWIKTRNKTQKQWKSLFFVLSDGTLSFYENELPRPHRLQGQMVLTDVAISVSRVADIPFADGVHSKMRPRFILTLTKEPVIRERLLLFDSVDRLLEWTYALECTLKIKRLSDRRSNRRRSITSTEAPSSRGELLSLANKATKEHVQNLGLDNEFVESRLSLYARKKESAVNVSIHACTLYKVCTLDPQGDENDDIWATIRARFMQRFRVYGGTNGRIMRGEEIVEIVVLDCIEPISEVSDQNEESPWRTRTRLNFRTSNVCEDTGTDADGQRMLLPPPI